MSVQAVVVDAAVSSLRGVAALQPQALPPGDDATPAAAAAAQAPSSTTSGPEPTSSTAATATEAGGGGAAGAAAPQVAGGAGAAQRTYDGVFSSVDGDGSGWPGGVMGQQQQQQQGGEGVVEESRDWGDGQQGGSGAQGLALKVCPGVDRQPRGVLGFWM